MKKEASQIVKTTILAFILAVGINIASADWTTAPASPPANNVDAPVNVGNTIQKKLGALWVNTDVGSPAVIGFIANGISYFTGNVGIGTNAPIYPLQVRRAGGGGAVAFSVDNAFGVSGTRDAQYYAIGDATNVQAGHAFYVRNGTATNNLALGITGNGNVGIGIGAATASQKLEVAGNIKTQGIMITNGATAGKVLTASDSAGNTIWGNAGSPTLSPTSPSWYYEGGYANGYDGGGGSAHHTPISGTHKACFVVYFQPTGGGSFPVCGVTGTPGASDWVIDSSYTTFCRLTCID